LESKEAKDTTQKELLVQREKKKKALLS